MHRLIALLFALLITVPLKAEEVIKMEGMSVIGNKESPNLLYIVPWKSPKMPDMDEIMFTSRLYNEALKPVNRAVLIRKKLYRDAKRKIHSRQNKSIK